MSEKKTGSSKIKDVIDATTGLVKAVPIYEDAVQPAAKEVGKSLQTVTKAINVALSPVTALIWGYSQIENFVSTKVSEKLKNVPQNRIITPDLTVAGPTLEALRYVGHIETLREMYANLLATSLDSKVAEFAHPSFVEIIKQLAPKEAELIGHLSNSEHYPEVIGFYHESNSEFGFFNYRSTEPDNFISHVTSEGEKIGISSGLSKTYLSNLLRLRILEIVEEVVSYDNLSKLNSEIIENIDFSGNIEVAQRTTLILRFSDFGQSFVNVCVKDD